jgi:hypothetical protein
MLASTLLVALALSAAPAAAPSVQVLIWGGGDTEPEARVWLERWKAEGPMLKDYLQLAEGFPKVVESKDLAGLKPGFFIVVLGFCPETEAKPVLGLLKALYAGAYARATTAQLPLGCPKPINRAEVVDTQSVSSKAATLQVSVVAVDPKAPRGMVLATLRKKTGELLDHAELTGPGGSEKHTPPSCTDTLSLKGRTVIDDHVCDSHGAVMCGLDSYQDLRKLEIHGDEIFDMGTYEENQLSCDD